MTPVRPVVGDLAEAVWDEAAGRWAVRPTADGLKAVADLLAECSHRNPIMLLAGRSKPAHLAVYYRYMRALRRRENDLVDEMKAQAYLGVSQAVIQYRYGVLTDDEKGTGVPFKWYAARCVFNCCMNILRGSPSVRTMSYGVTCDPDADEADGFQRALASLAEHEYDQLNRPLTDDAAVLSDLVSRCTGLDREIIEAEMAGVPLRALAGSDRSRYEYLKLYRIRLYSRLRALVEQADGKIRGRAGAVVCTGLTSRRAAHNRRPQDRPGRPADAQAGEPASPPVECSV